MLLIHRLGADSVVIDGQEYEPDHETGVFDIPAHHANKIASFKSQWVTPDELEKEESAKKASEVSLQTLQAQVERLTAELAEAKNPPPKASRAPKSPVKR